MTDQLAINERPRIQGSADLLVGAASVAGSLSSGELMASAGYASATVIGMGIALIMLAVAVASLRTQRVPVVAP